MSKPKNWLIVANRVRSVFDRGNGNGDGFAIISVEDLIPDRTGQYASGSAPEMIVQARILLNLHPDADLDYLERRIRAKSFGDHGIEDIKGN